MRCVREGVAMGSASDESARLICDEGRVREVVGVLGRMGLRGGGRSEC